MIHHVTALARDAERTQRFYQERLGLQVTRRGPSFDDPLTELLEFESGLSFLVYPRCRKAKAGGGVVTCLALRLPGHGAGVVKDPDGLVLTLSEGETPALVSLTLSTPDVPAEREFWPDWVRVMEDPSMGCLGYGGVHHVGLLVPQLDRGTSPIVLRDRYRSRYGYSPSGILCEFVEDCGLPGEEWRGHEVTR